MQISRHPVGLDSSSKTTIVKNHGLISLDGGMVNDDAITHKRHKWRGYRWCVVSPFMALTSGTIVALSARPIAIIIVEWSINRGRFGSFCVDSLD